MTVGARAHRLAAALVLALFELTAGAAGAAPDTRLGDRLYREGLNGRGEPVRALVGMPPKPIVGEAAACIACHGIDARGAPLPGAAAPDLRWSALAPKDGAGVKPYDERLFGRAVNDGIDAAGGMIGIAMPRYSLSRSEIAALAAFLRALPADRKR
jgi:mono/diheme cytochrome c family protein